MNDCDGFSHMSLYIPDGPIPFAPAEPIARPWVSLVWEWFWKPREPQAALDPSCLPN